MRTKLACACLSALLLSGCIVASPPPRYYAASPPPQYYAPPPPPRYAPPPPEAYYDGYYGPFADGYWQGGVFLFLGPDHHWHRDDAHHFGRGPGPGYYHVHGSGHGSGRY